MSTYYFSTSTGDDSRSTTQAQNQATPWKTLTKFNSFFASLAAGDSVLFNRGESYPGTMSISKNGSSGSPIIIGAWGSGAQPKFTGFYTVPSWTSVGNGLYEAVIPAGLATAQMVLLDDAFQIMGRWPKVTAANKGYLAYQTATATSVTSSNISGALSYVGGELVTRTYHWMVQRYKITAQTSNTVTITPRDTNQDATVPQPNFGLFFQNHINACTALGEWCYDGTTHKLTMFFGASGPGTHVVKVSSVTNLISADGRSFITFDNLDLSGADSRIISIGSSSNMTIQNSTISYAGEDVVWANAGSGNKFLNNVTNRVNNNIITGNSSTSWTISGNNNTDTGIVSGMNANQKGSNGNTSNIAYSLIGASSLVELNTITNVGYNGIHFVNSNVTVQKNTIYNACMNKDDGGAIYTWNATPTGCKVLNNIIVGVPGAPEGTFDNQTSGFGIYMDDNSSGVEIAGNSITGSSFAGFYIHNSANLNMHDNTLYNNGGSQYSQVYFSNGSTVTTGTAFNNNIIFSRAATQLLMWLDPTDQNTAAPLFSSADNNFYCRPLNENSSFSIHNLGGFTTTNLAGWQTQTGKEVNSKATPIAITDVNKIRFEYNPTTSPIVIALGNNYIDVKGVAYNGTITLQPFTSAVLLQTTGVVNQPPLANAGPDKNITLPTSTVSLTGSGTDSDGTITTYAWTKTSGPSTFTIATPAAATTNVNSLVAGTYVFTLTVTDNSGATASDTVQVVVNPTPPVNVPPIANAGTDKIITLPTNSVTQVGSGTDSDGTISAYAWTKTSGPTTFTISAPSSATTNFTGLVAGTYVFQLQVTDNSAATATDTVQVVVNPAPNQLPIASAGPDKNITLPTNSTSFAGSGTDADGTISTYLWTKTSGPSTFTIATPAAANTNITGLIAGTYVFTLTVTDNSGGTASDSVTVIVNPTPNVPPISNAGTNQTITLPTNSVTLTGSGTDSDGTISAYAWTKISGPVTYIINSPSAASTAVIGLVAGTYIFNLKVTDNSAATANSTVTITVNPAPNILPIANAGPNQTITLPTNTGTLTGSGTDSDGTIASYAWTKTSGPSGGSITSPTSATTGLTALVAGTYVFTLTVTDNSGGTNAGSMTFTVNPAPNIPPTADAGVNKTVTLPTNSVSVTGIGTDSDGTIASYAWTKTSGPSSFVITSPSTATTNITTLVAGTYIFTLTVTDNQGATGTDTMTVIVNPSVPPNQIPIVNADTDKNITLPTNSVSLVGSATDSDGTISSYAWTKIGGPATFTIVSPTSASTNITGLVAGTYTFRLSATDNSAGVGTDDVNVVVNPAPNVPPTANAGVDQVITSPTATVTLGGSGADSDGTISAYLWTKVSGPTAFNIVASTSPSTVINNLVVGTYVFQLQVTDNQGATGVDSATVTVNPPANVAPIANAGVDKAVTLPTSTVTLIGSGTDSDGTIASYLWSKISGPAGSVISAPLSATTDITSLVAGTYVYQLQVTDNAGASATDTVTITVTAVANRPPAAWAGVDKTINLPVSSVTFAPSASDPDNNLTAYLWSQVSGPSTAVINFPTIAAATASALIAGTYVFQFTATDAGGLLSSDTMNVIVNPALPPPNQLPTADAGVDKTITLPINNVTLTGSGTDPDGTINAYLWTKVSGPASGSITSINAAQTAVTALTAGTYIFQLQVTDNSGGTATDNVQVTVNPAIPVNQPPTANAGTDQVITLPITTVTVTGNGTDSDGTISGYSWTLVTGPNTPSILTPATAQTTINGLIEGVYQFQLKVTDNGGATGTDTVQITVNPVVIPPTLFIEAEAYSTKSSSPRVEATTDTNGGSDVAYTIRNSWTNYSINVPTTGTYRIDFRIAALTTGAQFQFRKNTTGTTYTTVVSVTVPQTGGFQIWQTVSKTVTLTAGVATYRIYDIQSVDFSLNWFSITKL